MRQSLIPSLLVISLASSTADASNPRLFEPGDLRGDVGLALKAQGTNVVLLAPRESVVMKDGGTTLSLTIEPGLCRDQRYARQRGVGNTCSGVLIDSGLVLTAAHCLEDRGFDQWLAVFGHDGDSRTPIRAVAIRAIRHCVPDGERGDLVALELAEPIAPAAPVRVDAPTAAARVHLLGHPFGLALKASTCAVDARCDPHPRATQIGRDWFLADLDAFGGNSGSPVYAADGQTLIGIWSASPTLPATRPGSRTNCSDYPTRPKGHWGGKATRVDGFLAHAADPTLARASCAASELP